jgi:hypothetical protein
MRQFLGGEESGTSNWVPHVGQMARSPESKFMVAIWLKVERPACGSWLLVGVPCLCTYKVG